MTEQEIQNSIRLALSHHGVVFRTNSGDFWQGDRRYSREFKQEVLINLRKVEGLPKGFTDLLFVAPGKVAFIETKAPGGRVRPAQGKFISRMAQMGHIAGIARSVEDAIQMIKGVY